MYGTNPRTEILQHLHTINKKVVVPPDVTAIRKPRYLLSEQYQIKSTSRAGLLRPLPLLFFNLLITSYKKDRFVQLSG